MVAVSVRECLDPAGKDLPKIRSLGRCIIISLHRLDIAATAGAARRITSCGCCSHVYGLRVHLRLILHRYSSSAGNGGCDTLWSLQDECADVV